jgi:hypothetical protein
MPVESSQLTLLLPLLAPLVALAGACVGSFLNVVAWRLPRQESVIWPGSHCPRCGTPLAWIDNLPLLGWFERPRPLPASIAEPVLKSAKSMEKA